MDIPQKDLLEREGQGHVLRFFDKLDDAGKASLLKQVDALDFASIDRMRKLLAERGKASAATAAEPEPAPVVEFSEKEQEAAAARGEAELRAGKVGVVLVAGGQGSRLGFDGPKGAYPVGPLSNRPLFFFHARKILALSRAYGAPVPFYIMTSETNDAATRAFFAEHRNFGLEEGDVFFFRQAMWPALAPDGRVLLDRPDHVFLSPDGHGGVLAALERSGALADMEARGIGTIFHFQVDNPMVDVAGPDAVGFHVGEGADVTLEAFRRLGPGEKMGMPVLRGGRVAIVEYTEFGEERMRELAPDGELRYRWAAPSPYLFSVPFLRRASAAGLPVHLAHKKVPHVDNSGAVVAPESPNAYKFEKFVFDALALTQRVVCLAFDREEGYSPVKNREGEKSPDACRADLSRKWARWLRAVGVDVPLDDRGYPLHRIEIDPAFARTAATLATRLAEAGAQKIDPARDILLEGTAETLFEAEVDRLCPPR
jgi:UDP-N-acetylglucosamine/UDP-N-acetylgalactosamine diphosphorylase